MAPQKKRNNFGNVDAQFTQILSRLFYFEQGKEQKSVRHFSDWCEENGYPIKDSMTYDVINGRSKPGAMFIKAMLEYSDDVELHQLFTADKNLKIAVAARVKTAVDMLDSVVHTLEGNGT